LRSAVRLNDPYAIIRIPVLPLFPVGSSFKGFVNEESHPSPFTSVWQQKGKKR
jgi:hypothetical protein